MTKDDLALNFVTQVSCANLASESVEHLGSVLRKGGVRD